MRPAKLPYLYEYPFDFTPYAKTLAEQVVGQQPTAELAAALAKVSGDPWSLDFQQPYTLYGATVFYLGPNQAEFATSKRYKYVIGIRLSSYYFNKKMYLVFNVIK